MNDAIALLNAVARLHCWVRNNEARRIAVYPAGRIVTPSICAELLEAGDTVFIVYANTITEAMVLLAQRVMEE